jgi:heme exporter protein D
MPYVIAAYIVVLAPLIGYAIHLRNRRRALLQESHAAHE